MTVHLDMARVVELLEAGIGLDVIAMETGCTTQTVKRKLRSAGIGFPDGRTTVNRTLPPIDVLLTEVRADGGTTVAERYGVNVRAVWKAIDRAGVPASERGFRRSIRKDRALPETALLIVLIRAGESPSELARKYRVNTQAIYNALRYEGFVLRGGRVVADYGIGRVGGPVARQKRIAEVEARVAEIRESLRGAAA